MTPPPDDTQAPPTAPAEGSSDDARDVHDGTEDGAVMDVGDGDDANADANAADDVVSESHGDHSADAAQIDASAGESADAFAVDTESDAERNSGTDSHTTEPSTDEASDDVPGDAEPDGTEQDGAEQDGAEQDGAEQDGAEQAAASAGSATVIATDADSTPTAVQAEPTNDAPAAGRALAWMTTASVTPVAISTIREATAPFVPAAEPDLLPQPRRRSFVPVAVPLLVAVGLIGGYAATTLLWPLDEVAPTVTQSRLATIASPTADIVWPVDGSAAVGVIGISTRASTAEMTQMASITKVITASMVLAERPLALGEQGEAFTFTWQDSSNYWQYLQRNESALDVPVDGTLTEYQLLQGVMLGSAGNYTDYLADWVWEDRDEFRAAAEQWLTDNGLEGIRVVEPTGIDYGNMATPAALVALGDRALQNPVFAEIVAQSTAELPGAGLVTNSNRLIDDEGVIGIKTGTLDGWNLLVAKEVDIEGVTVRIVASILDQPDDDTRTAVSRDILDQVTNQLAPTPAFPADTVVGSVQTPWGASAQIVTTDDATVVGWNGSLAKPTIAIELGDGRADGEQVGSLTVAGPVNTVEIPVALDAEIPDPDAWWRLTHPFELFGWDD